MSSLPEPLSNAPLPLPLRRPLSKGAIASVEDSISEDGALDSSNDAREIVRRVQCPQCSHPLDTPVTLPCGNTLCRKCIPPRFERRNITYPGTDERREGFTCPFSSCGLDHAMDDCSVDVVLKKIMEIVKNTVDNCVESKEAEDALVQLEERDRWAISGVASLREKDMGGQVLKGGRIVSTYTMAERGELAYDSEVTYTNVSGVDESNQMDMVVLEHLKEATRLEVDCQICYTLFYDPFTMTCGHTFCRKCLHRVLDHSNLCPICRRKQAVPPGLMAAQAPPNLLLSKLIAGLCPTDLAARAEIALSESQPDNELDTPLFICTLSFPEVPTFLHIFEPRYRLMIRRAVESGDRKFGMLLHNPNRVTQGELGRVHFYQYGTLLHIVSMHVMPDGRSLIETTGVSRFKVVQHGQLDGYTVGKIQRIDDITLSAEETLEARETLPSPTLSSSTRSLSTSDQFGLPTQHQLLTPPSSQPSSQPAPTPTSGPPKITDLNKLSTRGLYDLNVSFVKRMRSRSAPWLHHSVIQAYGELPTDMAVFPWWFASVLPLEEAEKYRLLATTSVRERLKITAGWVMIMEGRTWYVKFPPYSTRQGRGMLTYCEVGVKVLAAASSD
jgi:Lon protease-like protein